VIYNQYIEFFFLVTGRSADLIEASFHLAFTYEPDIISKVELVLETLLITHRDQKQAERGIRLPYLNRYFLEACSTSRNIARSAHNFSKETSTEERDVNESSITTNRMTTMDNETGTATNMEINKNSLIENSFNETNRTTFILNIFMNSSNQDMLIKNGNQIKKKGEYFEEKGSEQSNHPSECHKFVSRRGRFNSKTRDYDVFDATKSFLAWWTDCMQKRQMALTIFFLHLRVQACYE